MGQSTTNPVPVRHPWLGRLVAAPAAEIRALLGRYAHTFPYERAEPSDAAEHLLAGLQETDPAFQAFEAGCWTVLRELRELTGEASKLSAREEIASCADDILTVLMRVRPARVITRLHQEFIIWNNWAENLVFDSSLDVRREYLRLLALTQEIAAVARPNSNARRLLPLWLDICQGAGQQGPLNDTYLRVGILGLRRMPLVGLVDGNEVAVVEGLVQWASAQKADVEIFDREWKLVVGAYPRENAYWRGLLNARLKTVPRTSEPTHLDSPNFWITRAIESVSARPHQGSDDGQTYQQRPPSFASLQKLLLKVRSQEFHDIRPEVLAFLNSHRTFMDRTGVTEFFEKSAGNLGNTVLKFGVGSFAMRCEFASNLAQELIASRPGNAFGWSMWVSALAKSGQLEDAASVGWETIRRFPNDLVAANHLAATLYKELGLEAEAEALLRESLARSSGPTRDVGFARNQLAGILGGRSGSLTEAEELLRKTIELFAAYDQVLNPARNMLATLLSEKLSHPERAEGVLRDTLVAAPTNIRAWNQLALLLSGRLGRPGEAVKILEDIISRFSSSPPVDSELDIVVSRNQLAIILSARLDRGPEAEALLRETISKYPNNMGAVLHLENLLHRPGELERIFEEQIEASNIGVAGEQPVLSSTTEGDSEEIERRETPAEAAVERNEIRANGEHSLITERVIGKARLESHDQQAYRETTMLENIRPTAQARRLLTIMRASHAVVTDRQKDIYRKILCEMLLEEPNNAYLRFVANECGVHEPRENESVFALALQEACLKRDISEIDLLRRRFSSLREISFIERTKAALRASHAEDDSERGSYRLLEIVDEAASVLAQRLAA